MRLNHLVLIVFLLTSKIFVYGQTNKITSKDTLIYYWGEELHSSTLVLYNTNNTFYFLTKEDLWVHTSNGSFSRSGDTITLTCKTNCTIEFGNLKPVIVELVNTNFIGDSALFINTLGDTLKNYTIKINDIKKYDVNRSKIIQIWKENNLIYETSIIDLNSNGYIIFMPISLESPENIFFEKKSIIFHSEFLLIDGKRFKEMVRM